MVDLEFVDYGGYQTCQLTGIRLLKSQYFSLPIQGLKCRLGRLKPPHPGKWSIKAQERLLNFSDHNYWLATYFMKKIPLKVQGRMATYMYEVLLCDTNVEPSQVWLHIIFSCERLGIKTDDNGRTKEDPNYENVDKDLLPPPVTIAS